MPATAVPVAPVFGRVAGDDHLVPLARSDLVVAARTPVQLLGFVGLDVAHVDATVRLGPAVPGHGVYGIAAWMA